MLYFGAREVGTHAIAILAAGVWASAVANVLSGCLKGSERFGWVLIGNVVAAIVNLTTVLLAFELNLSLIGLSLSFFGSNFLLALLSYSAIRNNLRKAALPDKALMADIRRYSLMASAIFLVDFVVWDRSEVLFLRLFSSTDEIAYYNVSYGLVTSAMTIIPGSIVGVLLPRVSGLHASGEQALLQDHFRRAFVGVLALASALAGCACAFGPVFIEIAYGPDYFQMAPVLSVLAISGAVSVCTGVASTLLYGADRQKFLLILGLCVAPLNLGLAWLLVIWLNSVGAAAANLLTQLVGLVATLWYLNYVLNVAPPLRYVAVTVTAALAGATASAVLQSVLVDSIGLPLTFFSCTVAFLGIHITVLWRGGVASFMAEGRRLS